MIKNPELELIAQWELVRGMVKTVPDMKDFAWHFYRQLSPGQKRLLTRYDAQRDKILDDFLAKAEADGWFKPTPEKS